MILILGTLKMDHSFKFKLKGNRLVPTKPVIYLGALLNEHLRSIE